MQWFRQAQPPLKNAGVIEPVEMTITTTEKRWGFDKLNHR